MYRAIVAILLVAVPAILGSPVPVIIDNVTNAPTTTLEYDVFINSSSNLLQDASTTRTLNSTNGTHEEYHESFLWIRAGCSWTDVLKTIVVMILTMSTAIMASGRGFGADRSDSGESSDSDSEWDPVADLEERRLDDSVEHWGEAWRVEQMEKFMRGIDEDVARELEEHTARNSQSLGWEEEGVGGWSGERILGYASLSGEESDIDLGPPPYDARMEHLPSYEAT